MSRDFTKNVANYMNLPAGDATALSGSSITAFSLWANVDTLTAGSTSNYLFACPNPTSAANAFLAQLTGTGLLQVRGRAAAAESVRTVSHSIAISTGVWVQLGGQVDWPNDLIYTVMNGAVESHATSGWTATTVSLANGVGQFRIGQGSGNGGGAPGTASNAHDGLLAHVAFWTNALLTAADWAALGAGVLPLKVRPANLVLYRDLGGIDASETDMVSHGQVAITGSIPAGATEPPVTLFDDSFLFDPSWFDPGLAASPIGPRAFNSILRQQMAS